MNLTVTTDFIYIRFHGLEGGAAHDYTQEELEPWAEFITSEAGRGRNSQAWERMQRWELVFSTQDARHYLQQLGLPDIAEPG